MSSQPWKIAEFRAQQQNRVPPFAPSAGELRFYQDFLQKICASRTLPSRALVLGATPELRDAAISLGMETHAVDLSKEMMEKFSSLMQYTGDTLDKQIIGDWLAMDFPNDYFGIIMGDASFVNLATRADNERLGRLCHRFLAQEGFLVLRQVVFPAGYERYTDAQELIRDYEQQKISWEDLFMELRMIVFKSHVYNVASYQYDAKRTFELIDDLAANGMLSKEIHDRINTFRNTVINTIYPESDFIRMLGVCRFKHIASFHDKSFRFFNYLFMMAFQKH